MDLRLAIESSPEELAKLARDPFADQTVKIYAEAAHAYLAGDLERLEAIAAERASGDERVDALIELRASMRARRTNKAQLARLGALAWTGAFAAERDFLLGLAWERLGDDLAAAGRFSLAASGFEAVGCPRKALRAFYNVVAAESRARPYRNFVLDWQLIVNRSLALGDAAFAGMATVSLSREYQIVGLPERALGMAEEALRRMARERGTAHWFHALLQKAHVLLELGRSQEARAALVEAELAPFPEIQAARRLLLAALDPHESQWDERLAADLLPTWRERLEALRPRLRGRGSDPAPSSLEERLLKLLWSGPVEKWELIERLYGAGGDALRLENRFKNLMARVRAKYPGAVLHRDGRYSLEQKRVAGWVNA